MHSALIVQLLVTSTAESNADFLRSPADTLQLESGCAWSSRHMEFGRCVYNHTPKGFTNIPTPLQDNLSNLQSITAQQHSREMQPSCWMGCEQGVGKASFLPSPPDSDMLQPLLPLKWVWEPKKCWKLPNRQGTLIAMPTLGIS